MFLSIKYTSNNVSLAMSVVTVYDEKIVFAVSYAGYKCYLGIYIVIEIGFI